ncbi:exodeoxyribonuclease V subunit alpha [Neisseria leonii]|uniref:exodeoxyribonuclease V subunit alpha n=1 Tax=Neisseria leonii TaxID=2995413 RepID=UPI00237B2DE3|nr:exodeoxyribonuclease V subunit alpha [Neisseria sp. 3986]MDD9325483.1 exodeoxyribonuclease V subunit alpha [Neisseria sp. 3986]
MSSGEWAVQAAQAANDFLARHAPQAAEICAPFVRRLFVEWQNGHSYLDLTEAERLQLAAAVPIVGMRGDTPLQLWGRRLFLGRVWQLERDLASELLRLSAVVLPQPDEAAAAARLAAWFPDAGSRAQKEAAALALLQPLMLITGGPGTGKTTTVAKLLALLCDGREKPPRIALAAPTGKAAAHMARALHQALARFEPSETVRSHLAALSGQTVHRLLKLRPPQMLPAFDGSRPLPLDILVVDEASMLDMSLLLSLLRAVPTGCRVVLLGDENQLPSVGAGAVLSALSQPTVLDGETAAVWQRLLQTAQPPAVQTAAEPPPLASQIMRLTVSHRFGDDSGLGCLARAVAAGEADCAWAQFARFPQELAAGEAVLESQVPAFYAAQTAYWQAVDGGSAEAAFAHQADMVMLTARRQDAAAFNAAYRRYLQQVRGVAADQVWFAGQMIMVEENHYPLGVFNGDIGLVLPDAQGQLAAYFPSAQGLRTLALSRLPACGDAFALTVHKSQGSEYREVWLYAPDAVSDGLTRALLYTAVTRARERFRFIGGESVLRRACLNNETRRTALRALLAKLSAEQNTTARPTPPPPAD